MHKEPSLTHMRTRERYDTASTADGTRGNARVSGRKTMSFAAWMERECAAKTRTTLREHPNVVACETHTSILFTHLFDESFA